MNTDKHGWILKGLKMNSVFADPSSSVFICGYMAF